MHFILKKIIIFIFCFIILLSGCSNLEKAEAFYPETNENVVSKTQYSYYFSDELSVLCHWSNSGSEDLCFQDPFELHVLDDDGQWYKIMKKEEPSFKTNYCHGLDAGTENANARYDLSLYTDKLENGKTYRISTYCYNEDETEYYQVYAEFICDDALAEEEMESLTDGSVSFRDEIVESDEPIQIIGGNG